MVIFTELNDERYEERKVEVYRGAIPAPAVGEFSKLNDFTAVEIAEDDFRTEWIAAVSRYDNPAEPGARLPKL